MLTMRPSFRLLAFGLACLPGWVANQAVAEEQDETVPLVVKVYRVIDLVVPVPNYPYEGTFLPGMGKNLPGASLALTNTGAFGGMGGIGGGMGMSVPGVGGMGGAAPVGPGTAPATAPARMPMAAQRQTISPRMNWSSLTNAITTLIDPQTWEENGGDGAITPVGGALGINQTEAVHAKIEQFLTDLRRETGSLSEISIDAQWLALDAEQFAVLRGTSGTAAGVLLPEKLAALPASTRRAAANITCFNGQTVHVISGQLATRLQGAIPVVGGNEVGYQATITTPHIGTLLQITPLTLPAEGAALVDLQSIVTRPGREEDAIDLSTPNTAKALAVLVDRVNIKAQQLATSLRVPLGKPVLVGGMSFSDGSTPEVGSEAELYLILELRANESK